MVRRMRQLMRAAIELGTDAIKIGNLENIELVLADLSEDVRVLIAGGGLMPDAAVFGQISRALAFGAAGVCIGRNVFGSKDVDSFLNKLGKTVHGPTPVMVRGELAHAF